MAANQKDVKGVKDKTSIGLSQKQILFVNVLKKGLLFELKFLCDVIVERAADRVTNKKKLQGLFAKGLGAPFKLIPEVGEVIGDIVSEFVSFLFDQKDKKDKEAETKALLEHYYLMEEKKLEIIVEDCALEAACRWDMAINYLLNSNDDISKFANVGAARIIKYLCDKKLNINTPNLLAGLIGGYNVETLLKKKFGFSTTIKFEKGYEDFLKSINQPTLKTVKRWLDISMDTIEGLYGESGYLVEDKFYVHDLKGIVEIRKQRENEGKRHFGIVKYVQADPDKEPNDYKSPKYGYIQLCEENEIKELIDSLCFSPHKQQTFYDELRAKRKTRFVSLTELHTYIKAVNNGEKKSLNEYYNAVVYFRGVLEGTKEAPLDLSKVDFSGSNFSRCTLEHCILGKCHELILVGARLKNLTVAKSDKLSHLHNVKMSLSDTDNVDFRTLTGTQTEVYYAKLRNSWFNPGCKAAAKDSDKDDFTTDTFEDLAKGDADKVNSDKKSGEDHLQMLQRLLALRKGCDAYEMAKQGIMQVQRLDEKTISYVKVLVGVPSLSLKKEDIEKLPNLSSEKSEEFNLCVKVLSEIFLSQRTIDPKVLAWFHDYLENVEKISSREGLEIITLLLKLYYGEKGVSLPFMYGEEGRKIIDVAIRNFLCNDNYYDDIIPANLQKPLYCLKYYLNYSKSEVRLQARHLCEALNIPLTLSVMLRLAADGMESLINGDNNGCVLVIGATGSGKTSFVNYLAGNTKFKYKRLSSNKGELEPEASQTTLLKMEGGTTSVTLYPQIQKEKANDLVFVDCPGFGETREGEPGVCANLGVPLAVHYSNGIKAIIVVIEYNTTDPTKNTRGKIFLELCHSLKEIFKIEAVMGGLSSPSLPILFAISKPPRPSRDEIFDPEIIKTEVMDNVKAMLQGRPQEQEIKAHEEDTLLEAFKIEVDSFTYALEQL